MPVPAKRAPPLPAYRVAPPESFENCITDENDESTPKGFISSSWSVARIAYCVFRYSAGGRGAAKKPAYTQRNQRACRLKQAARGRSDPGEPRAGDRADQDDAAGADPQGQRVRPRHGNLRVIVLGTRQEGDLEGRQAVV